MYFLVLQQESSLLGLYGPVLIHLLGNTRKYSPSCQTNTENQLFQYCPTRKDSTDSILLEIKNVCIMTQVRIYGDIQPKPLGNPLGSALGISLVHL